MLMKRDERVKHVSPDDSKQAGRDGNRILQQRFMPEEPRRWCERFPTAPPSPPRFAAEIGVCHRAHPRSAAALTIESLPPLNLGCSVFLLFFIKCVRQNFRMFPTR